MQIKVRGINENRNNPNNFNVKFPLPKFPTFNSNHSIQSLQSNEHRTHFTGPTLFRGTST